MSLSPIKSPESIHSFSPKEITSPNKDSPGLSKTVYTHVSNLHGLLSDWTQLRDKGTRICRSICALKLHECTDDYYPSALNPLMETLLDSLESFRHILEGIEIIDNQLQALARLQPSEQAVIYTWSARQFSDCVSGIHQSLQKELRLKQIIIENIAHCREECLMEVYASAWELEAYFDVDSSSYLFAEVGLTGIS